MKGNVILQKSKDFAIRVVRLCRYLQEQQRECVLSKQLLKSGTSIGANVREADVSMTKPEFVAKLNISLKEAHETAYWLELLHDTDYLSDEQFYSIYNDCIELRKILISIIKSSKQQKQNNVVCDER